MTLLEALTAATSANHAAAIVATIAAPAIGLLARFIWRQIAGTAP